MQVFAVLFSFLILLQDTHALVRRNAYRKFNDDFDNATDGQIREKRFVGTALIVIAAGSAGLDIYKQEAGCMHITPDLQPTINKGKQLNSDILTLKEDINLAWVPVESKERYAKILATDLNIFREQLVTFNALQTDIITLLDNKILTKMDQFKRELQVKYCFPFSSRSSPSLLFSGKHALKICSKFTVEHPCQSVISIKFLPVQLF